VIWLLELMDGEKFHDFELFASGGRGDLNFVADFPV
jgi:hypothetical protein